MTIKKVAINKVINPEPKKNILVKVQDVDVTFGRGKNITKAMKKVSFNIYKGEVLGLVGESGSGKSTTGNAIMGLTDIKNGTINVDKIEINNLARKNNAKFRKIYATKAQMIFQDPTNSLNPQKTIKKVIEEGLNNIDIKTVFAKEFDTKTVTKLADILHNKKQPKYLEKLNLSKIVKLINNKEFKKIYQIIYEKSIKELQTFNTKYATKASVYLDLRKKEREYFLPQNKRISVKKIKEQIINETISSVGLSKQVLNRYPLEFSGGQQQRISICRSVLTKPDFIVADEPISALDVSIQAQVVNIFNELKEKLKLTILFIAHDLRMVEYISDRIAVMYKGQILETGPAKKIVDNPIHPYTKSLIASIPSIDKIKQNLSKVKYDDTIHKYTGKSKPNWFQIGSSKHFVYGTSKEIKQWIN